MYISAISGPICTKFGLQIYAPSLGPKITLLLKLKMAAAAILNFDFLGRKCIYFRHIQHTCRYWPHKGDLFFKMENFAGKSHIKIPQNPWQKIRYGTIFCKLFYRWGSLSKMAWPINWARLKNTQLAKTHNGRLTQFISYCLTTKKAI